MGRHGFESVRVEDRDVVTSEGPGTGNFLQPHWGDHPWGEGTLQDRFDVVLPLIRGGSVLDVGYASRYGRPDWLHGLLVENFPDVAGIDIDEETIVALQSKGLDVRLADAQDFDLDRKFDTVFAGEIIERLDDFHGFLTSVRRHLTPGGQLVLTTPNVFYMAAWSTAGEATAKSTPNIRAGSARIRYVACLRSTATRTSRLRSAVTEARRHYAGPPLWRHDMCFRLGWRSTR